MRPIRFKVTTFRLMLATAVLAIIAYAAIQPSRRTAAARRERCLAAASWHAALGSEYRKNANGDTGMRETAAWHEFMRREFERAAADARSPVPTSRPFPSGGWEAP